MKPNNTFNVLCLITFVTISAFSFWHGAVYTYMENERIIQAELRGGFKVLTSLPIEILAEVDVGI